MYFTYLCLCELEHCELFMLCEHACESRYVSTCTAHAFGDYADYGSLIIELQSLSIYSALLISLADAFSPVQPEVAPWWLISPSKRPPHLTTVPYLF